MNELTVKQKFSGLLAAIIVAFGALTLFLLAAQANTTASMKDIYASDYRQAANIAKIDGLLTRVDINILRMIAIGDPASIAAWKAENTERFTQVDKLIDELKAGASPVIAGDIGKLSDAYGKMRRGMNHQVQAIEAGDIKGGGEINRLEVKDNANQTFQTLSALKTTQDRLAEEKVNAQVKSASVTRLASLIAVALVTATAILGGLVMLRNLMRQLGGEPADAVLAAQAVASGDLSTTIRVRDHDGTSLMATLREMQQKLAQVVGVVRANAETVSTASLQIAQGNVDLSGRTEEQASSIEETAASMEELSSTVKNNTENARQANQLALNASEVARQGGKVVGQVVETMKEINASSNKIVEIISVIDGIAFQTNILALNAAVEAARAGEQGRGFAVVASEVRNLAQRSASAAKEIKELIKASVDRVGQGSALVDEAGNTMVEVVDSIKRVTDIMGEISNASVEQSAGVAQISGAIGQMDNATQQNAALVEESAAAAESLKIQAQALVEAVAVFKLGHQPLGETGARPAPPARPGAGATRSAQKPKAKSLSGTPKITARSNSDKDDWETF